MPTTLRPRYRAQARGGSPLHHVPNRPPRFPTSTPPPGPSAHPSGFSIRSQQDSALAFGSAIPSAFRPRPSKQSFSAATLRFQPRLSMLPFVPPSPRSSIPESTNMIPYLRVIRQSARSEILRPLRSLRLNLIGNWVLATLPHWQHSICLFSSEILVNGEFRLFDEDAFERREVVLHVNPPCGSQRFYYTKSAAHREPQIGYFLIKMSRKPPLFHPRSGRLIFALPHPDELVCIIAAPLRLGEKF